MTTRDKPQGSGRTAQGSGRQPRQSRRNARAWCPVLCLVSCAASLAVAPAAAAAQAPAAAVENVALAPIECWVRTSTNAVRVGERFELVLTCAVVETQSTTVVPDQSRLDPGVLQVPPFEVVGGAQAADLRTRTHRLFQYEYELRYLGEQIGADIELPGATINYRVQSRVQGDAAVESRDRQYILPATRMRIASLVPATANDIHDALPGTFRDIADRRFLASLLRIISWVLFVIGSVVAVWALAALVRRPREVRASERHRAPESAVLRAAARELEQVRRQRQHEGWTSDLAARALAALRLAGSYALGRPVAQVPAAGIETSAGQVRVPSLLPRRPSMLVSGSATAETVLQELQRAEAEGTPADGHLADLQAALARFASAAYGRAGAASDSDLDEALERATHAVRHVARRYTWPARAARAARQSAVGMRDRAWAR